MKFIENEDKESSRFSPEINFIESRGYEIFIDAVCRNINDIYPESRHSTKAASLSTGGSRSRDLSRSRSRDPATTILEAIAKATKHR